MAHCFAYVSGRLNELRTFIEDNQPQIMVTTIRAIIAEDRTINQQGRDAYVAPVMTYQPDFKERVKG